MTIKVKDTIVQTAHAVGIAEEVEKYLDGTPTAVGERDVALLLTCFQRVENELALDYLPLTMEEETVAPTGVVQYASLQKRVAKVLCVEDEWGNSLKYRLFPEYLKTQAGKVKIYYAYVPAQKTLQGESEYQIGVSARLFSYGMAAEYFLAIGDSASAAVWDKKYREGIRAAYRIFPCKRLRARRWA